MFSVGQTVYHKPSKRSGTVLECDGDRVFIVQANGAEADFPVGELTAAASPECKPAGYTMVARTLTMADVTEEHRKVLAIIAPLALQAVAALYERRNAGKFSALDVAKKLNFIAEVTAVPYRTMQEFGDRPGELRLMMGKGLADSQRRSG